MISGCVRQDFPVYQWRISGLSVLDPNGMSVLGPNTCLTFPEDFSLDTVRKPSLLSCTGQPWCLVSSWHSLLVPFLQPQTLSLQSFINLCSNPSESLSRCSHSQRQLTKAKTPISGSHEALFGNPTVQVHP